MLRKKYTLNFREEHMKAINAIMQVLGIKVKKYLETGRAYKKIVFKASEKELMDLFTRLDKYGIENAFI